MSLSHPQRSIKACLQLSVRLPHSPTARLDTELLLARVLGRDRTYLYTWPEKTLSQSQWQVFEQMLQQRAEGRPVAHLLGNREFWGLELEVNASTLIPRPETELLVETALALPLPGAARVLDLGTGSGAIALALASERPHWQLLGIDKSTAAVALAERNRSALGLDNVQLLQSDWFAALPPQGFDLIIGNPPYITPEDPHLEQGDVRFEPRSALVAAGAGLADIDLILQQAPQFLLPSAILMLEHGYDQGQSVRALFWQRGYRGVTTERDLGGNERLTMAQRPRQK